MWVVGGLAALCSGREADGPPLHHFSCARMPSVHSSTSSWAPTAGTVCGYERVIYFVVGAPGCPVLPRRGEEDETCLAFGRAVDCGRPELTNAPSYTNTSTRTTIG